jgi:hypothetical protein
VAEIDGKWNSTMNDVTPVYNTGTQDGDLWTQSSPLIDAAATTSGRRPGNCPKSQATCGG